MATNKDKDKDKIVIDPKKDEFKVYLEKTGISSKLSKILIGLYEEPNKPNNVDEFIARNFSKLDDIETVYLKNEIIRLRDVNDKQANEILKLKEKLEKAKKELGDNNIFDED